MTIRSMPAEPVPVQAGLGVAMALAAAALWGTTGTAQTFASPGLHSSWFGALRLLVGALFFAVYAWFDSRARRNSPDAPSRRRLDVAAKPARGWLPSPAMLGAGLCMAVYNLAFFSGVRLTGVAVGTAVALGSGPVWAGILQSLVTRQVPARGWWIGTAVAIAGGVLMTLSASSATTGKSDLGVAGVALCLLAGFSYAAYALLNKRLVQATPSSTVTLQTFAIAAMLALPAAWLESGAPLLVVSDAGAVLYVGVVATGVSYLLFSDALRHISGATGVTLALAEPVMAFAMAVLVVGERPSAMAFGGLLLVVAGVLAVVRAELGKPAKGLVRSV